MARLERNALSSPVDSLRPVCIAYIPRGGLQGMSHRIHVHSHWHAVHSDYRWHAACICGWVGLPSRSPEQAEADAVLHWECWTDAWRTGRLVLQWSRWGGEPHLPCDLPSWPGRWA